MIEPNERTQLNHCLTVNIGVWVHERNIILTERFEHIQYTHTHTRRTPQRVLTVFKQKQRKRDAQSLIAEQKVYWLYKCVSSLSVVNKASYRREWSDTNVHLKNNWSDSAERKRKSQNVQTESENKRSEPKRNRATTTLMSVHWCWTRAILPYSDWCWSKTHRYQRRRASNPKVCMNHQHSPALFYTSIYTQTNKHTLYISLSICCHSILFIFICAFVFVFVLFC